MFKSIAWAVGFLAAICTVRAPAAVLRTVALSGRVAPGTSSDRFSQLGEPSLNDRGQTAFMSSLTGDPNKNSGVWSEGHGSLALVARQGDLALGPVDSARFSQFLLPPNLTNTGHTSFGAVMSASSSSRDTGIWSDAPGSLQFITGEGRAVPGVPGARFYWTGSTETGLIGSHAMSDAGEIVVFNGATYNGTAADVREGIWAGGVDSFNLVALQDQAGPGSLHNLNYRYLVGPAISRTGQVVFAADFSPGTVTPTASALLRSIGGSVEIVARSATSADGLPTTTEFVGFGSGSVNDSGQIAFYGIVRDENDPSLAVGLWLDDHGARRFIALQGEPAPGLINGERFGNFFGLAINNRKQVAFASYLEGDNVTSFSNLGIWSEGSGGLSLVAREGDLAPDTAGGARFLDIETPVFNDAGQTAFEATMTGDGINITNDRGIWATGPSGALRLVVRSGQQLEVAPNDVRTIFALKLVENSTSGRPTGFNSSGQVAFHAYFTDNSQGIFVSNLVQVPEPSTGLLLTLAAFALCSRRNPPTNATTDKSR